MPRTALLLALVVALAACGGTDTPPPTTTATQTAAAAPAPPAAATAATKRGADPATLTPAAPGVWTDDTGHGYGDCGSVEAWIASGAAGQGDDLATCW